MYIKKMYKKKEREKIAKKKNKGEKIAEIFLSYFLFKTKFRFFYCYPL